MIEIVYDGKDNSIDILLKMDGVAQDLSSVTKVVLKVGSVTITDESPTAWPIKWSGLGVTGKVQMKLGDQGITAGNVYPATLTTYDPVNTNGIVWGTFDLNVKSV